MLQKPEAHAFIECWIRVNALNGDADGTGASQCAKVVVNGVPRSQEPELEMLRLLRLQCPRCCHDDGYHHNQC